MQKKESLQIGIIGTGYIGTTVGGQFHRHPDSTVAAITDIAPESRAEAASAFDIGEGSLYDDFRTMIEAEPLDAILVGTPHTLHYDQVRAGFDNDLHVLCDKPLTTDLDRAREIADRAETSDRTLMVGYQRHLNPAFVAARERFRESKPQWITAEITQNWLSNHRGTWRTDPDLSGGGMLYDTGSHLLDALLWISGLEPTAVSSRMRFADDGQRIDAEATVLVEFANGATANVSVSGDSPCVREHIHCWDDDGAVYLDGREWEPRTVTEIDAESMEHMPYIDRNNQMNKVEAFITAIEEDRTPPATVRDALRVTAVTEAAYEAARSDEWVDIALK